MKVIFLDRDGVINKYPGYGDYVKNCREFLFLSGVKEAIRKLYLKGFSIFIISNQAGIAKRIFSKEKLKDITKKMLREIAESGGKIKGVYYCPHRSEDNCSCRKPKIGLIQRAIKNKKIDLEDTYFIGDSLRDIETGRNVGCRTILVLSGEAKKKDLKRWSFKPDLITKDLLEATNLILGENTNRL